MPIKKVKPIVPATDGAVPASEILKNIQPKAPKVKALDKAKRRVFTTGVLSA